MARRRAVYAICMNSHRAANIIPCTNTPSCQHYSMYTQTASFPNIKITSADEGSSISLSISVLTMLGNPSTPKHAKQQILSLPTACGQSRNRVSPYLMSSQAKLSSICSATALEQTMGRLRGSVPSNAAELIVVRHGETTWNASGRLQGQAESELTDNGVKQAQAVADRLGKGAKDVAAVYSSDLRRAVETAQLIAEKCGCHEVIEMDSLRERHLGNLQGYTRAEAMVMEAEALRVSISSDHDEAIPGGGESLNQLYERTKAAVAGIAHRHLGQRVIIVSHGGVLRSLYMHAEGRLPPGRVQNTSINVFHISGSNGWTLRSWGDVNHLEGAVRSGTGGDELA